MNRLHSATVTVRSLLPAITLAFIFMFSTNSYAQVVNQATKKKISIGIGLIEDIWVKFPSDVKTRTINQGVQLFGMYNVPFGKSPLGFSIGLGLDAHNCYGNFIVNSRTDSTWLAPIPDSISYKRSKLTLGYINIPIEFYLKTKNKVSVALGFKVGMMITSSLKYVGDGDIVTTNFTGTTPDKMRLKMRGIDNLEQFTYGPTLRVGYAWFNVTASYLLSSVFTGNGPDMTPLSVGFVIVPF